MARSSHEVRDQFTDIGIDLLCAAEAAFKAGLGLSTDSGVNRDRKNVFIDAVEKAEATLARTRRSDPWYFRRAETEA
jgi:hypothetical protein